MPRVAPIRGVAIDYQREEERCFFAVDFEGRDTEVVWSVPRDRITVKRFHPIDGSLRIGSLAVSPDGRSLALRFGPPSRLTLPAIQDVHDVATDQISLVIPDEAARGAWLAVLSRTARALLLDGLPAGLRGRTRRSTTNTPAPARRDPRLIIPCGLGSPDSADSDPPHAASPANGNADDGEPDVRPATTPEDRLFFDYLRGDFAAAASDLGAVEPRVAAPEQRLSLLSLRAQILYSKGDTTRARAIVDYLIEAEGGPIHRVEETPMGPVLTTEPDSGQIWARYLSSRIGARRPRLLPLRPPNCPADQLPNPFAPVDPSRSSENAAQQPRSSHSRRRSIPSRSAGWTSSRPPPRSARRPSLNRSIRAGVAVSSEDDPAMRLSASAGPV